MATRVKPRKKRTRVSGWPETEKFEFTNEELGVLIRSVKENIKELEDRLMHGIFNYPREEYQYKIHLFYRLLHKLSERQPVATFENYKPIKIKRRI